jgi:hypothetical protein
MLPSGYRGGRSRRPFRAEEDPLASGPRAKPHTIEGTGHGFNLDAADACNRAGKEFLD